MNIAVFGGTGALGKVLVEQALVAGHQIRVLARTPEKMGLENDSLTVFKGDAFDFDAVSQILEGQDVVFCAIGGVGLGDSTTRSKATENILVAMEKHQVSSLVVCSTLGVGKSKNHLSMIGRAILGTLLRNAVRDHTKQEEMVQASNVNWVIVRPPRLLDGEKTEQYRVAAEDEDFSATQISRADVAHCMLRALQEESWRQTAISISL